MLRFALFLFLVLQGLALTSNSAFAGMKCVNIFSSSEAGIPVVLAEPVSVEKAQPIRLNDGDTYWGFYDCKSCGRTNTMKPSEDGRVRCVGGCGTPRTGEKYREPALFEKDGFLWLVDPGQISRTQQEKDLAKNGDLIGCPFCGNIDFKLGVSCSGCGANAKDPSNLRAQLRTTTLLPPLGTPAPSVSRGRPRASSDISGISNAPQNRMTPFTKRILGMAAGISLAAATTFGTVWGLSTHSEVARVVAVAESQVTVEYSVDGYTHQVELGRPAGETLGWRVGEPVTVSFVNWKMGDPSGGIRGNGDALQFLND